MPVKKSYDLPVRFRPDSEIDPVEESVRYVMHEWFQLKAPLQTTCFRCKSVSPVVFIPWGDPQGEALAFGNPRLLNRPGGRKARDITKETVAAFAAVGWKYQLRRAYCPTCKGLGSA
jgi:hypothetical protein